MKIYKILCVALVFFNVSCKSEFPEDVALVLNSAGANRKELIKAINHFKDLGDEKKIKAVYYFIGGMNNKYSYVGESYDILKENIADSKILRDSLLYYKSIRTKKRSQKQQAGKIDKIPQKIKKKKYNQFIDRYNKYYKSLTFLNERDFQMQADFEVVTSDYIIDNIEDAFKAWSMPWSKNVSFDQFCEYILPYKIGNEPMINWREQVLKDYSWAIDSLSDYSLEEVCKVINDSASKGFMQKTNLDYSVKFDYNVLKTLGKGSCEHCTNYVIFIMRGLGIPVSKETSSFLVNINHKWPVLQLENAEMIPFEACEPIADFYFNYEGSGKDVAASGVPIPYRKIAKIERFVYNRSIKTKNGNIDFYDDKCDVTSKYVPVADVELKSEGFIFNKKFYCLSIFDREFWSPKYFSSSKMYKVTFKDIARGVVYLLESVGADGTRSPKGNPFLLDDDGEFKELILDDENRQNIVIQRKFPLVKRIEFFAENLVGSCFQVANSIDFKNPVTLSKIESTPLNYYQNVNVNLDSKYRYFRMLYPNSHFRISISEIEVVEKTTKKPYKGRVIAQNYVGRVSKAFDGNTATYAQSKADAISWVGMEFDKPISIDKIRYLQRSDLNMIIPGMEYELVYWDDQWVSLGIKTATGNELKYANVPKNALFLLHNLTEGKEERIFLYEDGKQVFY